MLTTDNYLARICFFSFGILLFLHSDPGRGNAHAAEGPKRPDHILEHFIIRKNIDTCTERCHVNYMAYENKINSPENVEIFKHRTHSLKQDLDCISCHDDKEVNTEGHGKLIIKQDDCLKCHHVEVERYLCKECHSGIDKNPMKYKKERFLHGFTADSDVDCRLCHIKGPLESMKDKINCVKCHHTTPDLDCAKCHKKDIDKSLNTDLQQKDTLSWTVSFEHSQHPGPDLACKDCHPITNENDAGIEKYNLNCSKCHHASKEAIACNICHEGPSAYLKGELKIEGIASMPDTMSRAVKCEDCHNYDEKDLKFKDVKSSCIECHNDNYGKLHDAWRDTIKNRLREFNDRLTFLYEEGLETNGTDLIGPFEKDGELISLIEKYGIHNFNMTRSVLDYLENKADYIK